jgi:hypothetical protein
LARSAASQHHLAVNRGRQRLALAWGQLGVTVGSWSGDSLVYARQWDRNGAPIPGEINPGYLILDTDVGAMLGCTVIASNPNGTASADAAQVGPILEAARARAAPMIRRS